MYPLRPQSAEVGPYMIAGHAFTTFYGIDTTLSRHCVAAMIDGVYAST